MDWIDIALIVTAWNAFGGLIAMFLGRYYELDPTYLDIYYENINLFTKIVLTIVFNLLCPIVTLMYWSHRVYDFTKERKKK